MHVSLSAFLCIVATLAFSISMLAVHAKIEPEGTHPFDYYKEGTIQPYGTWKHNTGCHKVWIRVTMTDIVPSGTELLCTIEQRNPKTGDLEYTLWEGYLAKGENTGKVSTKEPYTDDIWVKLTETKGKETYFKIYIDGEELDP